MILAEKIMELRKKNGWSQEELAARLGVSRQSVSKWEGAQSIPDLDKILKLAEIFGVSTDYLLKDEAAPPFEAPLASPSGAEEETPRTVPLEEANGYMALVENCSGKIALGVALCILSPTLLIILGGLSDEEGGYAVPEWTVPAVGLSSLFVLVAIAVALFIYYGRQLEAYEYLDTEPIELGYGVRGVVERAQAKYSPRHGTMLVMGVALCILAVVPLFVAGALDENGMLPVLALDCTLLLVAAGVYLLVHTCYIAGSHQRLLEEGNFSRAHKLQGKRLQAVSTIYWCVVTATYLGWSFITMEWHRTWIVWPVTALLYGAIEALLTIVRK